MSQFRSVIRSPQEMPCSQFADAQNLVKPKSL
jgi:hypothetical protein